MVGQHCTWQRLMVMQPWLNSCFSQTQILLLKITMVLLHFTKLPEIQGMKLFCFYLRLVQGTWMRISRVMVFDYIFAA